MLSLRGRVPAVSTSLLRRVVATVAALLVVSSGWAAPAAAGVPAPISLTGSASASIHGGHTSRHACTQPGPGRAACHAIVRTDVLPLSSRLAASTNLAGFGYHPSDLQSAYGLTAAAASGGSGVTVALVDAYDDPTAEADLATYRATFGLPPCTSAGANPCFRKVNQRGQAAPLPAFESGWATEISLELDMVSAICPNCSILLVEADSSYLDDLGAGVNTAVAAGAKFISNSYGGPEDAVAPTLDTLFFKHPGVVITASTGDDGYEGNLAGPDLSGNEYPSVSPWVVAVGGTTLQAAANARGWTESAWSEAGSGCSLFESRPAWQAQAVTSCSNRMVADVSAVADPNTGVAVVYGGHWYQVGGTSASAPIVAAAYALAGVPAAGSWPASNLYKNPVLNDPIGGNNAGGSCSPDPALWCTGVAGYDGPTGLGSLKGLDALRAPGAPGAPGSVAATAGNASANVTWAAPASSGGAAVTGYTVTASPGGRTCAWTSGPLTCTVTGLTNGTAYTFTVRAANSSGTGPPSDPSAPVTPLGVPGKPQSVAGTAGAGSVAVTWVAPASDGGSAITGYTATASPGGASCVWAGGPLACQVNGLSNGSPYTFTVTATNSSGTGLPSSPSAVITPRTIPDAPSGVTAVAGNGAAQVTWAGPAFDGGSPVTGYTVTSSPDARTCSWSSGPLECTVSGLTKGTPYVFTVSATNVAGAGPASAPSTAVLPSDVPAAPTGVVAAAILSTPGALAVSWAAPDPGGSPITSYAASAFVAGTNTVVGGCTAGAPPNPVPTHCTITGLGPGTLVVRVSAANATGQGLRSAPSGPTTALKLGTAAVVGLPYWTIQGSLAVRWSGTPGAYPIAGYQVRYRKSPWNGSFTSPALWRSTTGTSATFATAAGFTYCFSARVVDKGGFLGVWSAERCTTTPLDDRSLARSGGWSTGTGSGYFLNTWSRSVKIGAAAVRTSVQAKQIVLVATSCPTCGTVKVYLGSTLLRSISLTSATTVNRRIFTVATFSSIRTGTVTVKLSSSGRTVLVDGLGISRM